MTQLTRRRSLPEIIGDHHTRIRRLEATAPGSSGSSGCISCNRWCPGCIEVPEEYLDCFDAGGGTGEFDQVCDNDPGIVLASFIAGTGGAKLSGLGLQLRWGAALGGVLSVYTYIDGSQDRAWYWPPPGAAGASYDSGWLDAVTTYGGACDHEIPVSIAFDPSGGFGGGCIGPGFLAARWVVLDDDGEFRGALDNLPEGDGFGDVIYFSTETNEFVTGPRSVPSRAISTFQG